jgi:hypothetical protein
MSYSLDGDKICGTCKWHSRDGEDWICVNGDSDHRADWTGYDDTCDEWEER